jgi:hypothetical protein
MSFWSKGVTISVPNVLNLKKTSKKGGLLMDIFERLGTLRLMGM